MIPVEHYTTDGDDSKLHEIYRFFEVDSLSDSYMWGDAVEDIEAEASTVPTPVTVKYSYSGSTEPTFAVTQGQWIPVKQKFVTEYTDKGYMRIIFGGGSEVGKDVNIDNASSFAKPSAPVQEQKPEPVDALHEEFPNIRVIGEAFGLYVICESAGKMIMIDKHAAHERIIFERLRSRNCRQFSQTLLTGIKVLLTAEEIDAMESEQELLADLGFTFDFTQRPCIVATAVPTFIMEADIEDIICEVANNLRMHKADPQSGLLDDMLHTVACKSAIKANDKNSPEELQSLAEQVCYNENIRHCPHGRPVMFTMTKYNIDHQFRRT
jgi:DNA mismatch repair ATPase MutL